MAKVANEASKADTADVANETKEANAADETEANMADDEANKANEAICPKAKHPSQIDMVYLQRPCSVFESEKTPDQYTRPRCYHCA